jgi:hypothetical protein
LGSVVFAKAYKAFLLSMDGIIHTNKFVVKTKCLQICNNNLLAGIRSLRALRGIKGMAGLCLITRSIKTEPFEGNFPGFCRRRMNRHGRMLAQVTMHMKDQQCKFLNLFVRVIINYGTRIIKIVANKVTFT